MGNEMSLPKWIEEWRKHQHAHPDSKTPDVYEALAIAWEALEEDGSGNQHVPRNDGCSTCRAMHRIQELGK